MWHKYKNTRVIILEHKFNSITSQKQSWTAETSTNESESVIHLSEHFMMVHWTELFNMNCSNGKKVLCKSIGSIYINHLNELIYKKNNPTKKAFLKR